jgi:hypothetical protein
MKSNLLLALFTTLLFSCSKQMDENFNGKQNGEQASASNQSHQTVRPFKATTSTWYRISPVAPVPVEIGGIVYTLFAHVPGGGQGNATHMGNINTWFNQLAFSASELPVPAGSLVASVVDVLNYPVLGAPLPLIQAGDFAGLAAANVLLNIPAAVNGRMVSSLFYNDKGDAVFLSNSTVSTITGGSATRSEFGGKALIVGGRGKFLHASGEVDFTGYFNPGNPNDAAYGVDGWISY